MTVTDADRQAAADLYLEQLGDEDGFAERIRSNTASPGCDSWEQAFARHRIAARDAALEEAAKVAEKWIEPVMATPHENATYRSIATAIRALKGPNNAD